MSKGFENLRRRIRVEERISERQSPHEIVLVIAGSEKDYKHWLMKTKLPRPAYIYLSHPNQLRGRRWENTYLLRLDTWGFNEVVNRWDGVDILNQNFPGWNI